MLLGCFTSQCGMSHTCVGGSFVFLMGLEEEEEVEKNLGCEDFMTVAFQRSPFDY